MQFDDPQQHIATFVCAPSDTSSVVHLLSADGCCGNCGAFCYRPQEIAGSVCPRVCVTLDSPQLCSLYLCVCAPRICVCCAACISGTSTQCSFLCILVCAFRYPSQASLQLFTFLHLYFSPTVLGTVYVLCIAGIVL